MTRFRICVGALTILTNAKASHRSVMLCAEHLKKKLIKNPGLFKKKLTIFIFRNPYNRLVSGYLNKYVEHTKYLKWALEKNSEVNLGTFQDFVYEIKNNGVKFIDPVHFKYQVNRIRNVEVDYMFDAENLDAFYDFINRNYECQITNKIGGGELRHKSTNFIEKPYLLKIEELRSLLNDKKFIAYKYFYTDELKKIVKDFYKPDFDYAEKMNFKCEI